MSDRDPLGDLTIAAAMLLTAIVTFTLICTL